jgi:choline transport protein
VIAKKDLSFWILLALAFNICNCWASVAGTFALSMVADGPPSLLYGMILTTIGYLCIALTLAELVSVYPTAGGQYHFTSILAPKSINKFSSYLCGIIAVFSWIAIGASISQFPALQIMALALNYHPNFHAHAWHYFLIYQAANIVITLNNVFLLKKTNWTHTIGFCLTIVLFAVSIFTTLGRSTSKQSHDFVWITFVNLTGWDEGFAFLYGLLVPCFMYCGLDGALHVAEECPNPKKTVPKVLLMTVGIGFATAFVFTVVMAYCITSFIEVYFTSTGYVPLFFHNI